MADCPNCEAPKALYFSPSIAYPQGNRANLLAASRSGRVLLAVVQFIGFILFAVSYSAFLGGAAEEQAAAPFPFREIGLGMFLVPFPLQILLTYLAFRLRRVPVHIGHDS